MFYKKGKLLPSSNAINKVFITQKHSNAWKKLSAADMLSLPYTKAELQINQLKHKQLPSQIDFAILQESTIEPEHYLIKHEEVLPHLKQDSLPILADYGTDQFPMNLSVNNSST